MDFPVHIDTVGIRFPILYFKRLQVEVSELWHISFLKVVLILANSADPDERQHNAAFHLGHQCLTK